MRNGYKEQIVSRAVGGEGARVGEGESWRRRLVSTSAWASCWLGRLECCPVLAPGRGERVPRSQSAGARKEKLMLRIAATGPRLRHFR